MQTVPGTSTPNTEVSNTQDPGSQTGLAAHHIGPDSERVKQALAVLSAADVMLQLGASHVWLFRCPECQTPGLLEERNNSACCGYCGRGPWQPLAP